MKVTSSGFENDEQHGHGAGSLAVRRGGVGAEAWRLALHAQQVATPDHADFYGLTRELVAALGPLASLMRLVSGQVAGYAEGLPAGRSVYDDTREVDPRELLAHAAEVLADIGTKVGWAALEMNRFWSLIGRIGVEDDAPPDVTPDVTP